jgi:multidrug efflux pump subunit AcrA (membrane-fusion protein)
MRRQGDYTCRPMNEVTSLQANELGSDDWAAFTTAASDEAFCLSWLALQCSMIPGVRAGLLLLRDQAGQSYVPAAVWPDRRHDVTYLTGAAERALAERRGTVLGLDPDDKGRVAPGSVQVACPLEADAELAGAIVVDVRARPERELQAVLRQLLWGTGWLVALLRRRQLARDAAMVDRAAIALDLVQAAHEHPTLPQAAMAVVNELATVVNADRVSLGIQKKARLELRAISRTAWFDPKSHLVEAIEGAMEEAIDQAGWIAYPVLPDSPARVNVAQRDLASRSGSAAVLSVPIVSRGQPIGALTLERTQGEPFDAASVVLCEAVGELLGPALQLRLEGERWFSGRIVATLADWRDRLIGPRRPVPKVAAVLLLIAALLLAFADGEFRVSARTIVEGAVQRATVAPFDGYITEAFVRAGSAVRQGQVLATLDDRDLKLERARWEAEKEQVARKYREALAKHDRAASRVLAAQLSQVEAQLALSEEKLARTQLVAPFDGVVVSGDLSQMLGAPVEKGKVLFELAPLGKYRVILQVDERDIAHVTSGQRGELALTGVTGANLPFTIKTVTSVATAQEGRNFFRAEAQLEDTSARMRPGMEGVGKISIGERRLLWIWTRNFVNWLRISFWTWMP